MDGIDCDNNRTCIFTPPLATKPTHLDLTGIITVRLTQEDDYRAQSKSKLHDYSYASYRFNDKVS